MTHTGNEFTVNGRTFRVIDGNLPKAPQESLGKQMEKIYDRLLIAFAKAAKDSTTAVQDVLHDVLLEELEREARGLRRTGIGNLLAYLKTAALRELWRVREQSKRLVPFSKLGDKALETILETTSREPDPLDAVTERELELLAALRLERLPLRQRHVLALWCSGLEIPEIAERANTTSGNVRFHKHAAIQAMRDAFRILKDETA
jgi:RNA polymerase sigma factor (sigma-70 family)